MQYEIIGIELRDSKSGPMPKIKTHFTVDPLPGNALENLNKNLPGVLGRCQDEQYGTHFVVLNTEALMDVIVETGLLDRVPSWEDALALMTTKSAHPITWWIYLND